MDDDNQIVPGVYATGWIKRGPVGLIGHTKSDAMETSSTSSTTRRAGGSPPTPSRGPSTSCSNERGVEYTDLEGWHRLDEHEMALGEPAGPCARQGRAP